VVFFSSRRRHTSFSRDWSSDVCSSDLIEGNTIGCVERLPLHKNSCFPIGCNLPNLPCFRVWICTKKITRLRGVDGAVFLHFDVRSEERRVGKEDRRRGTERQTGK